MAPQERVDHRRILGEAAKVSQDEVQNTEEQISTADAAEGAAADGHSDAPEGAAGPLRVAGFRFAGVASGIKADGKLDLGLIVADEVVPTAAVFTRNRVRAAPVLLAEARVRGGKGQAVLVNSGNANAATGEAGKEAALRSTKAVAKAANVDLENLVPASTGVIGVPLPAERIVDAAGALVRDLDVDGLDRFAEAILTTDQGPKVAHRSFQQGKRRYTVVAIAKGAGMIHPNMATTLAFVLTDAPVKRRYLRESLRQLTEITFNRISVDGDTSTNDTIVAMASGAGGGKKIDQESDVAEAFTDAMHQVLEEVALMVVSDGEGAQHTVRIDVDGAPCNKDALIIARTIATSPLVKTAIHGGDPNWGRLLAAAGRAGVRFDPERVEIFVGDVEVYHRGENLMTPEVEAAAAKVMEQERYGIRVRIRHGEGKAFYWTCDLGHNYVTLNADYRS